MFNFNCMINCDNRVVELLLLVIKSCRRAAVLLSLGPLNPYSVQTAAFFPHEARNQNHIYRRPSILVFIATFQMQEKMINPVSGQIKNRN